MKIMIGSAWPYANGPLHIGHIAALLPADVIARYYRAKGADVYFVSGSDCHGTPVAIRAKQENKTPQEISGNYHTQFCECFEKLGFAYDRYGKTSSDEHKAFVQEFHKKMYEGGYIYEKASPQAFCQHCNTALADRFVIGKCPGCNQDARGDQCDACGNVLEPENLVTPQCSVCKSTPEFHQTNHLFIAISKLEKEITNFLKSHPHWRKNAIAFTQRYIDEGLRDRAITRGLDWGIDVPKNGFEDKKIYVWAEAVLGYLSMSEAVAKQRGKDPSCIWDDDTRHYYVHGKDNIPFHTIILPALLMAHGGKRHLPDDIVSSEYLTLEGRKISTSQNWAVWVKDIVDRYHPDSIRYFLLANGPEKRDTDFTWREFVNSHNGGLLGAYGNFINRTLSFVYKYYDGKIPAGQVNPEIEEKLRGQFQAVGNLIEKGSLKDALGTVFELVRFGNKYFDSQQPWITRNSDAKNCAGTIYNCVQLIANFAVLLEPFLPFSSAKVMAWLGLKGGWGQKSVPSGFEIPMPEILFQRLDKKVIEEELARLNQ
ncbi:MAG: methionine--tRNA ligase [Defluviitaleaceae bacterium]|nr:methionine--tRNA ligase [Defluviitaleaceae bacterium]